MINQHTKDVTVGSGRLFAAELDANGAPKGYLYLGDSEGFTLNASTEQVETWTGDGPIAQRLISQTVASEYTFDLTLNEVRDENFALFFLGESADNDQEANASFEQTVSVKQGQYVNVGATSALPAGVKDIDTVVVTDGTGVTTYVATDDYIVDAEAGQIYIVVGGDIASAGEEEIIISCDVPAATYEGANTSENGRLKVALMYREDTNQGETRDFFMPRVDVRPSGSVDLKSRDSHQQIPISGTALVALDGSPAVREEKRKAKA